MKPCLQEELTCGLSCWAVPEVSPPCVSIIPKGAVSDNAQEHHHASAVAASKSWRRGAQQRRWSTNHGMRPCSSCNFVCPLPLAHTHCQASLVQYNGQAGARITTRRSAGRAPARHTLASGKQPPLCGRPGPFGRLHLHTKQHNIPQGHTSGTTLADLRGAADIVANPGSLSTPARHFPSPPRLVLAE